LGEDERAWHPDGAEPPEWFFGLAIVAMGLVMLLLALLAFGVSMTSPPPAPGHTPTTYGPPPTDRIG
jgi:hypothetical protein